MDALLVFKMRKYGALNAECAKGVAEVSLFEAAGYQVYGHVTDSSWHDKLLQLGDRCVYNKV
jgi:hypothetical protein